MQCCSDSMAENEKRPKGGDVRASEQVKEPTRGHEKGIQVAAETVPVPGGTQKQDGAWE